MVAVVVGLAIAGVVLVDAQGRLQLAAATASRALGRADTDTARAALAAAGPGTASSVTHRDVLVCVTLERRPAGPLPVLLHGTACAADGGG
ncbi:hypothetical protein BIU90_16275 [Curtobacterium sp. MCBA15_001]|nr:hypothetical protein BIU90_16275 [Curtobacterium sp. MCBA15_001]